MSKNKVCWKITTKCNQRCKYCFGFVNIKELSFDENIKVLNNLIEKGLTNLTFTGGEAILYPRLNEMIKYANSKGIYTKLVTNGIYIAQNDNEYIEDVLNNLKEINLSIDSISNEVNLSLGKENNHLDIIKTVLEKTKDKSIKVGVNTVISKKSIDGLEELGEFLNNYKIYKWKFLKFMPIREKSLINKESLEVTEKELIEKVNGLKTFENIQEVQYKKQDEFERSIVVLPNAEIIRTDKGIDYTLGNALNIETTNLKWNGIKEKIKTLIAYNNKEMQNKITNILNGINGIEIVATTSNPEETYNKIVEFKPEMVFSQYDFGTETNGLDIIRQTKKVLNENVPAFNFIATDIPKEEYMEAKSIIGDKMNTIIREQTEIRYNGIIEDYKKYLNENL